MLDVLPLFGILLLFYVIYRLDRQQLFSILKKIDLRFVAMSFAIFSLNLAMRAFRWFRVLSIAGISAKLGDVITYYLSSMFYGSVTFGRLGELYRMRLFQNIDTSSYEKDFAFFISAVDRVIDVLFMALLSLVLVMLLPGHNGWKISLASILGPVFIISVTLIFSSKALYQKYSPLLAEKRGVIARTILRLLSLLRQFSLVGRMTDMVEILMYTALSWILYILSCYFIVLGLNLDLPWSLLALALFMAILVSLLPVTFQGFGTREIVFISVFSIAGISKEGAVSVSIAFVLTMLMTSLVTGSAGIISEKFHVSRR